MVLGCSKVLVRMYMVNIRFTFKVSCLVVAALKQVQRTYSVLFIIMQLDEQILSGILDLQKAAFSLHI